MKTEPAYFITGAERASRWVITCDHARNRVPSEINGGDLGLPAHDMERHIAYDIGAEPVSLVLGELLNAPVICSNFSRMVIDPNRGEDDPTLIPQLYDGSIIPANRHLDSAARQARIDAFYRPYHDALGALLDGREAPVVLGMHSFTPQLQNQPPRPWQIGILHAHDTRLCAPLIDRLRAEPDLCVGDNEPYNGHMRGDSFHRHALAQGRLNCLIEIRNDLIGQASGQQAWAQRLAPILQETLTGLDP